MWHFVKTNIALNIKESCTDKNCLCNIVHETQQDINSKDNQCVLSTVLFKQGT
jgi:hypothetical protein